LKVGREPVASVVVLSDFASGTQQGWDDLRRTLTALARQNFEEPIEYLLIESEDLRADVPPDLRAILPSLRVVFSSSRNSYELRNDGVRAAACDIVGTIDGDCAPSPDWVRHMVAALRTHPRAAAVSGRTIYDGDSFESRASSLLERGYIEEGGRGPTRHIANNGAGFRRTAYLAHPLPTGLGVFASQLQAEAMMRAGYELLFEPRMQVTHAYYPTFAADHRRGIGYGTLRIRLESDQVPYARLARLGYLSVAIFFLARLGKGWARTLRDWRGYGIRWYEVPRVLLLAITGCVNELPGMLRAVRGQPPPETGFR
jgi:hypothetical protein